jgi:hypothetical protein
MEPSVSIVPTVIASSEPSISSIPSIQLAYEPTQKPSFTPSIPLIPSIQPTLTSFVPSSSPLLQRHAQIVGLKVTLRGIYFIQNWREWEETTSNIFNDFYNRSGYDLKDISVEISITDFMVAYNSTKKSRRKLNAGNDKYRRLRSEPLVTITFSQDLYYRSRDPILTLSGGELATYPLSTEANREKYVAGLKLMDSFYEDLWEVSEITAPNQWYVSEIIASSNSSELAPPEPDPSKKMLLIVIGVLSGLLCLAVLTGYEYYQKANTDLNSSPNDGNEVTPPEGTKIAVAETDSLSQVLDVDQIVPTINGVCNDDETTMTIRTMEITH